MTQDYLFEVVPSHRLDKASREELIQFIEAQERVISSVTKEVKKLNKNAVFNPHCKSIIIKHKPGENTKKKGNILIMTAGTSDIPVAEEAKVTAEFLDNKVTTLYDVGVAGIHRLLNNKKIIEHAKVVIVVAGMEGALPSVVSGLFEKPIIAVPTSVGYGANFKGLAALLTMLNSCSPGITVVNIDNGFGAACLSYKMLHAVKFK